MTKKQFLDRLGKSLNGLPQEDISERLTFYGEMIDDRAEEGLTEEEAVAGIGSVEEIASQILEETPFARLVKERVKPKRRITAWEIVLLAVGSPVWLSLLIALLAVVLSLYVVFWAAVICLWAAEVSLIACALAGAAAGILQICLGRFWQGVALAGAGCVCAGLAVLLYPACKAVTKATWTAGKKIMKGIKKLFLRKGNQK
jgi:Predicted membrane protein